MMMKKISIAEALEIGKNLITENEILFHRVIDSGLLHAFNKKTNSTPEKAQYHGNADE